jgi:AcrR family transcriptional regulator
MARQADRTLATRGAILATARELFGQSGFARTSMDRIAAAAGVAKGAVYHHFPTKEALFEAVFRDASLDLARQLSRPAAGSTDALAAISHGVRAYFAACASGPFGQIILKDGPAVLGWELWREIDAEHFGRLIPQALDMAMSMGLIQPQKVEPLAGLILGAMNEAAAACNASEDPATTGADYARAFETLLEGLRRRPQSGSV